MTVRSKHIIGGVILGVLFVAGFAFQKYVPGLRAPFFPPPKNITDGIPDNETPGSSEDTVPPGAINETNLPLKLPAGFSISIFAKNLPGARVMAFDRFGNMWVSRTSDGAVALLEVGDDGNVRNQGDVFRDLKKPHGLAFDPELGTRLFIAEENRVRAFATYSEDPGSTILDGLPSAGGHFTRTIAFGPDGKLYISIGSSCNVCHESDEKRAAILRFDLGTKVSEIFARGLRNTVFFGWHPSTKAMWGTEMGRDWLGDDTPPDEINVIEEGKNYGWPNCYGKNIHDNDFDKNTYIRNPCMAPFETPSVIDIPAHSAPLGLAFIPQDSKWPKEYWGNLLVAFHGSWNRTKPTGYKVVRYVFNEQGTVSSEQDFISGWLTSEGALGRPVDILVKADGTMYLSDDKAGVIYRIAVPSQ